MRMKIMLIPIRFIAKPPLHHWNQAVNNSFELCSSARGFLLFFLTKRGFTICCSYTSLAMGNASHHPLKSWAHWHDVSQRLVEHWDKIGISPAKIRISPAKIEDINFENGNQKCKNRGYKIAITSTLTYIDRH